MAPFRKGGSARRRWGIDVSLYLFLSIPQSLRDSSLYPKGAAIRFWISLSIYAHTPRKFCLTSLFGIRITRIPNLYRTRSRS